MEEVTKFIAENIDTFLLAIIAIVLLIILVVALRAYNKICHIFISQQSCENHYARVTDQNNTIIKNLNEINERAYKGKDLWQS